MGERNRTGWTVVAAVMLFAVGVSACGQSAGPGRRQVAMAALADMPESVQHSAVSVQDAYRFAVANPEVEKAIPCYCGCGAAGHHSNYACFVSQVDASGAVTFDGHAIGCSICVDIALDAKRLMAEGKTIPEIRAYVDGTYGKFGPSNM